VFSENSSAKITKSAKFHLFAIMVVKRCSHSKYFMATDNKDRKQYFLLCWKWSNASSTRSSISDSQGEGVRWRKGTTLWTAASLKCCFSCWQISVFGVFKFFLRLGLHYISNLKNAFMAFHCHLPEHEFYVSQGSVETLLRWGGKRL